VDGPNGTTNYTVGEFNCSCVGISQCLPAYCKADTPNACYHDVPGPDLEKAMYYTNMQGLKALGLVTQVKQTAAAATQVQAVVRGNAARKKSKETAPAAPAGPPDWAKGLYEKYAAAGQEQVFDYAHHLTSAEASAFKKQLESIDVAELASLSNTEAKIENKRNSQFIAGVEHISKKLFASCDEKAVGKLDDLEVLKTYKAAVCLVACASGTRYGVSGSIGLVDIGLPSKMTLFALAAERVAKLSELVGGPGIPLVVTTLEQYLESTMAYFKANDFFGLVEEQVEFFATKALPCVTEPDRKSVAKIQLEGPGRVAMSDGSGNVAKWMSRSGVLQKLSDLEVKWVHFCPVENVLNLPCYPPLIAECQMRSVEACRVEARGENELVSMVASTSFLAEAVKQRPVLAPVLVRDTVAVYGPKGRTIKEAIRIDVPLSQALTSAGSLLRYEVEPSFFDAPISRVGSKSTNKEKALQALVARSHAWLSAGGASVIGPLVEVTPSLSYCGEGLAEMSGQKLGMAEPSTLKSVPRPVTRQGNNVALKEFRQYFKTPAYVGTPR
jgi:hypothetical protein